MAAYTPACRRCHIRKIKCDTNKPSCRPCMESNTVCQPHERQRRFPSQRTGEDARRRLTWLEDTLSRQLGVNMKAVRTGTNLGEHFKGSSANTSGHVGPNGQTSSDDSHVKSVSNEDISEDFSLEVAPDISLLTLNATGELRYLGPSSGSFFAKYASNFARSFLSEDTKRASQAGTQRLNISPSGERLHSITTDVETNWMQHLTPQMSKYLLGCYAKWVQPMFPLLDQSYTQVVLEPFITNLYPRYDMAPPGHESQKIIMVISLLALALGAVHVTPQDYNSEEYAGYIEYQDAFSGKKMSPDLFFIGAVNLLDSMSQAMQPSIPLIQIILLICIYGGYKPSGNRQWQLSGIAIRTSVEIGLHRDRTNWKFNAAELDLRRRVFWTAYAVELSAAFNLGRPQSIPDEHIDAQFPAENADNALALHHIRHRQIQSRILGQVYCAPHRLKTLSDAEKNAILHKLQSELEDWRTTLSDICAKSAPSYPLEYWERLYWCTGSSLLRPNPLFPRPPIESTNRCIKFAGKFIEIHHHLLKSTNVPQSWMLVQGTLLCGITILVMSRMNAASLLSRDDFSLFEVMEWSRKCSLVLTIISERWAEQSISHLEAKFSLLSTDTLKKLLTLKDNPRAHSQGQEQRQTTSQLPATRNAINALPYDTTVPSVADQLSPSQNSNWAYANSFQGHQQGADYAGQSSMGPVNFPILGDFLPDWFDCGESLDPCSLEGFFGGDDMNSFWEVLPGTNDPPLHFGQ